jgi:nucleotide-binding universal stress UspA family protein
VFSRILVALDGSPHAEAALSHALRIARASGGSLRGVHVIDRSLLEASVVTDLSGAAGFQPFLNLTAEMRHALVSAGEAIIASFEARSREAGLPFSSALAEGSISEVLEREARETDLVAAGSRGANARDRGDLIGRHADALARKLHAPLLLCPDRDSPFERPLAAYDGSPKARKALLLLADLARLMALPVTALTVADEETQGRAHLSEAEKLLRERGVESRTRLARGHPDEAILAAVAEGADLVAIGAHGHGRIVELVLGSTTDRVLRRAAVPVLCAG